MLARILLYPKDLQDFSRYESGTKIADINTDDGFGVFMIKKRFGVNQPEFLWLPKKGYSDHLEVYKNIQKMTDSEFETYVNECFNILIKDNS